MTLKDQELIIAILKNGGVGVLPTDTIYGLVGSALLKKTVERIYKLRRRNKKKPMIVLIGSLKDLSIFKIQINRDLKSFLFHVWPGKVSVILPCSSQRFSYLHRGGKTLAFRLPRLKHLRNLLARVGPLVAPSANTENLKPAENIASARRYFGKNVDFYFNKGKLISGPSTLVIFKNSRIVVKRQGVVKINYNMI